MMSELRIKINDEINIEINDKICLINDGITVLDILEDDFNILKSYLYRDVERSKKKLTVKEIRLLLNCIDREIKDAVDYVIKYNYKKGGMS